MCSLSWSHDPMEEALVRVKGRDLHVVPVQTRVSEVRLALQERRRTVHSVTEVVVVITERSLHALQIKALLQLSAI